MTPVEFLESRISVLIPEDIGSQLMYKSNIKKAKAMETVESMRVEKLETLAKLLAASWFYGDWKWESPNERVQQMLMQELGYFPFKDEDEMIRHTRIDDNLYKQAIKEIPARGPDSMDFVCTTEDCPHCAEDIRLMEDDDGLTDDEWVIQELKKERDTPMIVRLREHLSKITPEEFNKEIDEIAKELGVYKEVSEEEETKLTQDMLKQPMRFHCVPKEISDEEIEKFFNEELKSDEARMFAKGGAKWYREQLKSR